MVSEILEKTSILLLLLIFVAAAKPCEDRLNCNSPSFRITGQRQSNKSQLVLGSFANYGGNTLPMGQISPEGVRIALEAIRKAGVLSDYEVVIDFYDDKMCESGDTVAMVISHVHSAAENSSDNVLPIITGPTCSDDAFTGHFLQYYNYVGLADGTIILEIPKNRQKYNSFFMMRPSFETFYEAIPMFLKSNNWDRVFLLTETFTFWTPFEDLLQYNMMKSGILLAGTAKVLTFAGGLPPPETFQQAVRDLASYDPRIIILNTHFGAIIACWLHRYGLYGPRYVYVFFGPSFFLPNSKIRAENCTDEMLSDVLQSVVYYSYGAPNNLYPDAVDVLGTTAQYFDDTLKARIDHPELNDKWFYWRSHTYSEIVATALTLNYTETKLRQNGDTLMNWVTKSDNFKQNGSYIHSILIEALNNLRYKGLNTYEKLGVNGRTGITGFFQMQLDQSRPIKTLFELTAAFRTVPIAVYDLSPQNTTGIYGHGKAAWRTRDGHPPFDSLKILEVKEPIFGKVPNGVLSAFAALLMVANLMLLGLNSVKSGKPTVARSLPLLNSMIPIGNVLILCFVFVLPVEGDQNSYKHCIAASLFVVAGFSLISATILVKMHIAFILAASSAPTPPAPSTMVQRMSDTTVTSFITVTSTLTSSLRQRAVETTVLPLTRFQQEHNIRLTKRAIFASVVYTFIQVTLISIWMGLEPPITERVNRRLELSREVDEIAYQPYTYACRISIKSPVSQGILATLIVCYLLVVLRSIYLAILLRKRSLNSLINDLHLFRIASEAIVVIVIAGGAATAAFFMTDIATLEIAASALAIIVVFSCTCLIFGPKLKKTYYF